MLTRPLILGDKGGMGRRYAAILRHLGMPFLGVDAGDELPAPGAFDSVIICTPTHMHVQHIRQLMGRRVPILTEKPVSTNLAEVLELCRDAEEENARLTMVNQYAYLETTPKALGDATYYDYWRSGSDGLAWDCINVIGLAKDSVTVANRSPVWSCAINGQVKSLAHMDKAYVAMIKAWLLHPAPDVAYIRKAHIKTQEYIDSCKAS